MRCAATHPVGRCRRETVARRHSAEEDCTIARLHAGEMRCADAVLLTKACM